MARPAPPRPREPSNGAGPHFNRSGLPEVVRHGVDGFLEPLGDTEAMAEDALTLLRDRNLRKAFGASAQERALTTFAEDPIVDQYEAAYETALSASKRTVDFGARPR